MISIYSYTALTLIITIGTILYSYGINQQFYTTVMHLTHSGFSLMVLCNFAFCSVWIVAISLKKILFGKLTDLEYEDWVTNMQYSVIETAIAMTMFPERGTGKTYFMFVLLLLAQSFHWICESRLESMEQQPAVTLFQHLRFLFVITSLSFIDMCVLYAVIYPGITQGFQISLTSYVGFEFAILASNVLLTFWKYIIFLRDHQLDGNWPNKQTFVFIVEFFNDIITLSLFAAFYWLLYTKSGFTLPFYILRELIMTGRGLYNRIINYYQYRRALNELNNRFPDATIEEINLHSDGRCVICREDMRSGKKLPCGHIFHFRCLQDWMSQQQICPMCRSEILNTNNNNNQQQQQPAPPVPAPVVNPQPQQQPQQQPQNNNNNNNNSHPPPPPSSSSSTSTTTTTASIVNNVKPNTTTPSSTTITTPNNNNQSQQQQQQSPPPITFPPASSSPISTTTTTTNRQNNSNQLPSPPIPPPFPFLPFLSPMATFPTQTNQQINSITANLLPPSITINNETSTEVMDSYIEYLEDQVAITRKFRNKLEAIKKVKSEEKND